MDLSVREVATLLGKSTRTVRAQVARGDIPARKRNGRWMIPRHGVPLTENQRRSLQDRADELRRTLDEALPSRLARNRGRRFRSVADLEGFRKGAELLTEMRTVDSSVVPNSVLDRAARHLERALLSLAEAALQYDRRLKLEALNRARSDLARAVARLLIHGGTTPEPPIRDWIAVLEGEVIPAVAGFTRWAERLKGAPR